MRLMLAAATGEKATGSNARVPGYFVAGKTGTAQKVDTVHGGYVPNGYISSFAGFLPANNPRYVIYLAVDSPRNGYYGGQVAAPMFARVAQYMVRKAGLPPVQISASNVIAPTEERRTQLQTQALAEIKRINADAEATGFPNLLGLSLREALKRLENRPDKQAAQIRVRGHGVVVRTVPEAGTPSSPKTHVTLVLENPD
jgi:cell division protein FtsI (penicillin-binding protein 3)